MSARQWKWKRYGVVNRSDGEEAMWEARIDHETIAVVVYGLDSEAWWASFSIGGEDGGRYYLSGRFATAEGAVEAAVKSARETLAKALEEVNGTPLTLPPFPSDR